MSRRDPAETLGAYHDGELSWWRRRQMEAQLRRSPELRAELETLRALGRASRETESAVAAPDLWASIAGGLRVADAEIEAEGPPSSARVSFGRPALAAVAAGALVVAVTVWLRVAGPIGAEAGIVAPGSIRTLDTGGRAVWVDETESATIIWLVDADGGEGDA